MYRQRQGTRPADHQVHDQIEILFKNKNDPLSDPIETGDRFAPECFQGRVHTAEYKRTGQPDIFQHFTADSSRQSFDVDRDVGIFGQFFLPRLYTCF